jgi:uncharacterized membrane protein YvbJ
MKEIDKQKLLNTLSIISIIGILLILFYFYIKMFMTPAILITIVFSINYFRYMIALNEIDEIKQKLK